MEVLLAGDELCTWPAFTEGCRWMIVGRHTRRSESFINKTMLPMKQLPELRSLVINGARISYKVVPEEYGEGLSTTTSRMMLRMTDSSPRSRSLT